MTKKRMIAVLGALTLLLSLVASPARADKPEPELGDNFLFEQDTENDLVVFWNITRDAYCDWVAGGFMGAPPVQEQVPARVSVTRSGATVLSWHATRPLELWQVDDPENRVNECADTDDQEGPWATGEVNLNVKLTIPGPAAATNSGMANGQGTVDNEDGRWHYSWTSTGEVVGFELVNKQAHYNLSKKGN